MSTRADYPQKRKERIEQEYTDEMLASQAEQQGISIDEMRTKINENPVWAARLDMAASLERRRKFQRLYNNIRRFLKNHPDFLSARLRAAVAGCFDAIEQLVSQRGTDPAEIEEYLEQPLIFLRKGAAVAIELSEAEDTITTKKSKDNVLTLYETLTIRLRKAETDKNEEQKKKIRIALDSIRPQAKRRMRALEPDYIVSLTNRLRILRLEQDAQKLQEEILRQLSSHIRDSVKELAECLEDEKVTKEILSELSGVKPVIDYSSPEEKDEPPPNVETIRKEIGKEQTRLNETVKRIDACKASILELKEIENAVIETLFPEFEINRIEWDVPVKTKESKVRVLARTQTPGGSSRMVRGERADKRE